MAWFWFSSYSYDQFSSTSQSNSLSSAAYSPLSTLSCARCVDSCCFSFVSPVLSLSAFSPSFHLFSHIISNPNICKFLLLCHLFQAFLIFASVSIFDADLWLIFIFSLCLMIRQAYSYLYLESTIDSYSYSFFLCFFNHLFERIQWIAFSDRWVFGLGFSIFECSFAPEGLALAVSMVYCSTVLLSNHNLIYSPASSSSCRPHRRPSRPSAVCAGPCQLLWAGWNSKWTAKHDLGYSQVDSDFSCHFCSEAAYLILTYFPPVSENLISILVCLRRPWIICCQGLAWLLIFCLEST